nr:hypothetical protein GCM10020093_008640 [Planobispora longispora]
MSVVDDLRDLILRGRYAPGARLGEVELAETLGVSRTPVREALRRLQAEGLVEVVANRGARVAEHPAGDLETVFELRARIEGLAARQAAAVATAEDADRLHGIAVALREHAERHDLDAVYRLNADFHQGLVRLGGSAVLAQSLSALIHSPSCCAPTAPSTPRPCGAALTTTSRSRPPCARGSGLGRGGHARPPVLRPGLAAGPRRRDDG